MSNNRNCLMVILLSCIWLLLIFFTVLFEAIHSSFEFPIFDLISPLAMLVVIFSYILSIGVGAHSYDSSLSMFCNTCPWINDTIDPTSSLCCFTTTSGLNVTLVNVVKSPLWMQNRYSMMLLVIFLSLIIIFHFYYHRDWTSCCYYLCYYFSCCFIFTLKLTILLCFLFSL